MSIKSFPGRTHTRHRTPPALHRHVGLVLAGPIVGAGAVAAVALRDVPTAVLLVALLTAALLVAALNTDGNLAPPVTGADLLTTVSTMRVTAVRPAAGHYPRGETALAMAVGVYVPRHSCDTPTGVIPAVRA